MDTTKTFLTIALLIALIGGVLATSMLTSMDISNEMNLIIEILKWLIVGAVIVNIIRIWLPLNFRRKLKRKFRRIG